MLSLNWASGGMFDALLRLTITTLGRRPAGLFHRKRSTGYVRLRLDVTGRRRGQLTINDMFTVTLGGENLFDEYPDTDHDGTLDFPGVEYALTSPYGFNGGFYLRLSASF